MRELQRFRHQDFGDFVRAGFHHQDGFLRARDAQIKRGNFHLLQAGVHDELAIHKSDPHRPDRTAKGDVGDHQSRGGGVDGEHVQRVFGVGGKRHQHDLHLIAHAFGEERAQRAVRQTGNERGIGGGASLTAEEGSGDPAAGIHTFFVIDGQREKVAAFTHGAHRGGSEHHAVALAQDHRPASLARDPTGFKGDFFTTKGG